MELVVSNASGQVNHIARGDVIEIKKQRSQILFYAFARLVAIPLALAGGALGFAIERNKDSLAGPLLGALVVGIAGGLAIGKLYRRSEVIYRAP